MSEGGEAGLHEFIIRLEARAKRILKVLLLHHNHNNHNYHYNNHRMHQNDKENHPELKNS
jgi:hypothetical protein